jgi:3-oxoadipate enol-lactonase
VRRWFSPDFSRHDQVAQVRATVANTTVAGYCGCAAAIIDFDVVASLPSVTTPTLVVCGDGDVGTPPEGNRRIARLIPGARYEEVLHARHLPNLEQPDIFNRIMIEWLTAIMDRLRSVGG